MGGGVEGWTEKEEKGWDTRPEEHQTDTSLLMVCVGVCVQLHIQRCAYVCVSFCV